MIVGTTLFKFGGNPYYTPEFPRGGLAATFAVVVINLQGSPTINVSVEHRNSEDTSFTPVTGGSTTVTTTGLVKWDVTAGIKEIVRIGIEFDGGDEALDAIHFLIQAPSWRPYP